MRPIAHIFNDFDTKFGVPRQSGVVPSLRSRIVFLKEYRVAEAFRGIEGFDFLWLIWDFSEAHRQQWSPTVRPPRLGGNRRLGVFATRSPFRPNNLGLSSVRLVSVDFDSPDSPALIVEGADLMNNTPIYDVKPYLPYTDSHPDARAGFVGDAGDQMFRLNVFIPDDVACRFDSHRLAALRDILANDPRPHYKKDGADKTYVMQFAGVDVKFLVEDDTVKVLS